MHTDGDISKPKEGYLRVTQVLFPFSGLTHIPEHILNAAAERGTKVHLLCDAFIEGFGIPEIPENIKKYYESFEFWAKDKKFHAKPERFYDELTMVTGECDAVVEEDGGLTLVDFKTSAKEGKTWALQGAAYAQMAIHLGYPITKIQFVKLCKFGKPPEVFVYDYKKNLAMWLMCLSVYKEFFLNSESNFEGLI